MKSAAASRPLWQAAAVAAGLSTSAAMAAEWTVEPSAEVFTLAQQNPRLAAGNDDNATAFGTRAGARMQRRTEQLVISLQPSAGLVRYQNVEDLDRNDQQLTTGFTWQGEHISWRGSANGVRDTTLTSELGNTGLTQENFRHESYSVSAGPEWQLSERLAWGSNAAWQVERYPGFSGTALTGSHYSTVSTYLGYSFSDRTAVSAAASAGRLTSGGGRPGSDNGSVSLQARHALTSLWTIDVSAGPSWMRVDNGKTESGRIYNAEIARTLERGSVSLGVNRRQSPSGRGVLTEVEEASLGVVVKLTEYLTGTVNAAMSHRTDALSAFGVDLQEVRYSHADLGVSWRPAATWQLSLAVGNSTQKAEAFLRDQDTAHGYYARVSLGWLGKPVVN